MKEEAHRLKLSYYSMKRWENEFTRAERTLIGHQASGLAKITAFVENHQKIILALFGDLYDETMPDQSHKK